jgi:hypothetical protein
LVFREERLFFWEGPAWMRDLTGFILMFLKDEGIGMKMKGKIPVLWLRSLGPKISDGEGGYQIVQVSSDKDYIWLKSV